MPSRGAQAALGWLLTLLLALLQAFVYKLAPPQEGSHCLSIFTQLPPWHGQAYITYGVMMSFVVPDCLLGGTCSCMLSALSASSTKEEELSWGVGGSSRHHCMELLGSVALPPLLLRLLPVAKCALPSPRTPHSLSCMGAWALQLTLALTMLFALCGFLCFVLELSL